MPPSSRRPRQRMDHRRFQRFGRRQMRQDTGQALGKHRLARAGRADHHQMVPTGCRDFQRSFRAFLPLDLGQVPHKRSIGDFARFSRGKRRAAGEMRDGLRQVAGRDDLGRNRPRRLRRHKAAGQSSIRSSCAAAIAAGRAPSTGISLPSRDNSPSARVRSTASCGRMSSAARNCKRDRQVEMTAFLGQIGGRQVDDDALRRKGDCQRVERCAHPGRVLPIRPCRPSRRWKSRASPATRHIALRRAAPRSPRTRRYRHARTIHCHPFDMVNG